MLDTPILAGIPVTGLARRVTSGFGAAWPGSSRPGRASPKGWRSLPEPQLAGAPGAAGRPGGAPAEKDEYLVVLKFTKNVELMRGVKM